MLGPTTARVGMFAAVLGVAASLWLLSTIWSTPADMDTSRVTALSALADRIERARADLGEVRAKTDRAVRGLETGATGPALSLLQGELIPTLAEIHADVAASEMSLRAVSSTSRDIEPMPPLPGGDPAQVLGIDTSLPLDAQVAQLSAVINDISARAALLDGVVTTVATDTQLGMARSAIGNIGGRAVTTALAILALTISGSLAVVAYTENPNRGAMRTLVRRQTTLSWVGGLDLRWRARQTAIAFAHAALAARSGTVTAWERSRTAASSGWSGLEHAASFVGDGAQTRRVEDLADRLLLRADALSRRVADADVTAWVTGALSRSWSQAASLPTQIRESVASARTWVSEFSLRSE